MQSSRITVSKARLPKPRLAKSATVSSRGSAPASRSWAAVTAAVCNASGFRLPLGFTLGVLGRSEEAIAVYDDVVARFGAASELLLREGVATALANKG